MIDLDEAFRRAVQKFYDGAAFENYEKATGNKIKYSKEFFDGYEKELRPRVSKKKLDKEKPVDDVDEPIGEEVIDA